MNLRDKLKGLFSDFPRKFYAISLHGGSSLFITMAFLNASISTYYSIIPRKEKRIYPLERIMIEFKKSVGEWKKKEVYNFRDYYLRKNDKSRVFEEYLISKEKNN